jgi:pectin methylesterase-like acyl-CoA thioesterase
VTLIYKPVGIVLGILAGLISKRLFEAVWSKIDDQEPPEPTTQRASWPKVLGAAAVQGVTFKVTRAAVDRAGAKGFAHVTGVWPGEKDPEPE